jgi:hypothetical protein
MATKKKILVFENQPQYFESTELFKYLKEKKYEWDFACTLDWELGDLLKCGFDLVKKYDTIATETFFGYVKGDLAGKDDESDGGQLREMVLLLEAVLPLRKKPLNVLFSQKILDQPLTNEQVFKYITTEPDFIRFSSATRFVVEHENLKFTTLNLYTNKK